MSAEDMAKELALDEIEAQEMAEQAAMAAAMMADDAGHDGPSPDDFDDDFDDEGSDRDGDIADDGDVEETSHDVPEVKTDKAPWQQVSRVTTETTDEKKSDIAGVAQAPAQPHPQQRSIVAPAPPYQAAPIPSADNTGSNDVDNDPDTGDNGEAIDEESESFAGGRFTSYMKMMKDSHYAADTAHVGSQRMSRGLVKDFERIKDSHLINVHNQGHMSVWDSMDESISEGPAETKWRDDALLGERPERSRFVSGPNVDHSEGNKSVETASTKDVLAALRGGNTEETVDDTVDITVDVNVDTESDDDVADDTTNDDENTSANDPMDGVDDSVDEEDAEVDDDVVSESVDDTTDNGESIDIAGDNSAITGDHYDDTDVDRCIELYESFSRFDRRMVRRALDLMDSDEVARRMQEQWDEMQEDVQEYKYKLHSALARIDELECQLGRDE